MPEIAFSNNGYLYPGFDFGANKISINKGQNNLWLCCHESIHAVLYMYYGLSRCWHGEEFVFLMAETMSKLEKRPKTELIELANNMGIEYTKPDFLKRIYRRRRPARDNTYIQIRTQQLIINEYIKIAAMTIGHGGDFSLIGSGSWIRTNGLRVMSPTSFHCSIPRRISFL